MNLVITKEMMEEALKANGWNQCWTSSDWVHEDWVDQDHGIDLKTAFAVLLQQSNILSIKNALDNIC